MCVCHSTEIFNINDLNKKQTAVKCSWRTNKQTGKQTKTIVNCLRLFMVAHFASANNMMIYLSRIGLILLATRKRNVLILILVKWMKNRVAQQDTRESNERENFKKYVWYDIAFFFFFFSFSTATATTTKWYGTQQKQMHWVINQLQQTITLYIKQQ